MFLQLYISISISLSNIMMFLCMLCDYRFEERVSDDTDDEKDDKGLINLGNVLVR